MGAVYTWSRAATDSIFKRLLAEAAKRGVPDDLAHFAATATSQRMEYESFGSREQRELRLSAYFWGVVRRQAFRGPRIASRASLRRRLVAASIAQDMRASGVPNDVIRAEVARCYGEELAAAVVDRMPLLAASA